MFEFFYIFKKTKIKFSDFFFSFFFFLKELTHEILSNDIDDFLIIDNSIKYPESINLYVQDICSKNNESLIGFEDISNVRIVYYKIFT